MKLLPYKVIKHNVMKKHGGNGGKTPRNINFGIRFMAGLFDSMGKREKTVAAQIRSGGY
jgi:hypothetical protein